MRKATILTGLMAVLLVTAAAQAALTDNLVAYWKFNNNGEDETANNLDVTVTTSFDPNGFFDEGLARNNYASRADDGVNSLLDIAGTDWSIAMWIEDAAAGGVDLFNNTNFDNTGGFTLYYQGNGQLQFFQDGPNYYEYRASDTPSLAGWHYIVYTFKDDPDDPTMEIYVDGTALTGANVGTPDVTTDSTATTYIGARGGSASAGGPYDEVAVWHRALSAAEVGTLYNSGDGLEIPEPATLSLLALGGLAIIRRRKD